MIGNIKDFNATSTYSSTGVKASVGLTANNRYIVLGGTVQPTSGNGVSAGFRLARSATRYGFTYMFAASVENNSFMLPYLFMGETGDSFEFVIDGISGTYEVMAHMQYSEMPA